MSINFRLGSISFADHISPLLKIQAKQFSFLTQLAQLVLDEILYKQTGTRYSMRFLIEKQYHHIVLLPDEFSHQHNGRDIFKEIYRQISANNLIPEPSVKLLLHSAIFSSLTFAYSQLISFLTSSFQLLILDSAQKSSCLQSTWTLCSITRFIRTILSHYQYDKVIFILFIHTNKNL